MKNTPRSLVLTAITALVLAACSSLPAAPVADAPVPLLTEADLAHAVLDLPKTVETVAAGDTLVLPAAVEQDTDSAVTPQAVLPNTNGYLVYVRFNHLEGRYEIWRANQSNDAKTLIYAGLAYVESAAVSLDGNTFFFTASPSSSGGAYELYRFVASSNALSRLTRTPDSETSVSTSTTGRTVVWEGSDPLDNSRRALYLRDYSASGASDSVSVLVSSDYQGSPTVSSDGNFVAFIRFAQSQYRVMLYNKLTKSYQQIASSSLALSSPSPGNGKKVAWVDYTQNGSTTTYRVRVRDLASGSVSTAVSESQSILAAHLPAGGKYLTWVAVRLNSNGDYTNPVFTKNLDTGQVATAVPGSTAAYINDAFWQK